MRQDPFKDNPVIQNLNDEIYIYIYKYYITHRYHFVDFSIRLIFKTLFYGESDAIHFKFDNKYHGDLVLRQQHNTNKQ